AASVFAGAATGAESACAASIPNVVPVVILSPTCTLRLIILPAFSAGISMEALSVSSTIIESPSATSSPTLTPISIISAASVVPISGSIMAISVLAAAGVGAGAGAGAGARAAGGAVAPVSSGAALAPSTSTSNSKSP